MEHNNVNQCRDDVVIFVKESLEIKMPPFVPDCSIHRVPKRLFSMNPSAYKPKEISIGPYHYDEKTFKTTQELKLRFFNSYRSRVGLSVQRIVEEARSWEGEARTFYSEPTNMKSKNFVKMMVLDGCFIVEFMIMKATYIFPENENKVHSSFYKAMSLDIGRDLIMLENQLPFFVLERLFDLVYLTISKDVHERLLNNLGSVELFKVIVDCFLINGVLPIKEGTLPPLNTLDIVQKPRHLLDFLSFYFVPKENSTNTEEEDLQVMKTILSNNIWDTIKNPRLLVNFLKLCCIANAHDKSEWLPPSVTELTEAGVVLKKVEREEACIMHISFENGILNIPPLLIDDRFETYARNLLAFSQFSGEENENTHVENAIHYFRFLDELITTEKDVNLLVNKGIILNQIGGSDKEISKLFNSMCRNITVPSIKHFSNIGKDLRQHCKRRRNRWMATLRTSYFNTPWALISFLAATFLILLTLLQTIFSGISTF